MMLILNLNARDLKLNRISSRLANGEDVLMEGADDQEPENLCRRVKLDWCSVQIRKGQIMRGPAVSQLVYLLNEAFQGTEREWHALGTNLRSITSEDWLWVPPDGTVPAGGKLRGQISYEVPTSLHNFTLTFQDSVYKGNTGTWNFSV
jgi:hypothetical protein